MKSLNIDGIWLLINLCVKFKCWYMFIWYTFKAWGFQKEALNESVCLYQIQCILHVFGSYQLFLISLDMYFPMQYLPNSNRNEYTRNIQFYNNLHWETRLRDRVNQYFLLFYFILLFCYFILLFHDQSKIYVCRTEYAKSRGCRGCVGGMGSVGSVRSWVCGFVGLWVPWVKFLRGWRG